MMDFVNWGHYSIPNMMGKMKNVPNHQPGIEPGFGTARSFTARSFTATSM
jgi:hypothetical protein